MNSKNHGYGGEGIVNWLKIICNYFLHIYGSFFEKFRKNKGEKNIIYPSPSLLFCIQLTHDDRANKSCLRCEKYKVVVGELPY